MSQGSQRGAACGDEQGSLTGRREKEVKQFRVLDVIPDQQPRAIRGQPVLYRCHHPLLIAVSTLWELEVSGNATQTRQDALNRFPLNPEDRTILQGVTIRILQGDLGFANSTKPI